MEPALVQLLRNLSVSLASTDTIDDALELGLSAAIQMTQTEFGRIYLKNAAGQSLKLYAHCGIYAENTNPVAQYAADSKYVHNLSAGCATLARNDNFDFSNFQKSLDKNIQSFLTLPLQHSGQLIGVLNLASTTLPIIAQEVQMLLESVAAHLTSTIVRVQSISRHKESEAHLRSLLDSATGFAVYRLVFDESAPYSLRNTHVSPSIEDILGYKPEKWQASSYYDNIHPDDQAEVQAAHEIAFETRKFEAVARVYNPKIKAYVWIHAISIAVMNRDNEISHVNGILIDVTEKQRTCLDLENKTETLNQLNATLNILLEKRDKDRAELEQSFVYNIREMALPYLGQMKKSRSFDKIYHLLGVVEMNLHEITSRFIHRLSIKQLGLSPAELRVAAYVKHGKTSKEIAAILGLSTKTIKNQRDKIRKKLGITNQKTNLRSHLLSLGD